jgi:hypothetical protein
MSKVNISHVSNMHSQWLRILNFYQTEIGFLREILTEIAGKYTGNEVAKEVEHFENQFTIQKDNMDILVHDIHANVTTISEEAEASSAGYINGKLLEEHTTLGERTESEEKAVMELILSFRKFAAKWM